MMELISKETAIKAVTMLLDDPDDVDKIWSCDVINNLKYAPTVDAMPIEPLCDFLARNYEPLYDLDNVHDLKWPIDKDQQKAAWMKVLKRIQNDNSKGVSLE